MKSEKPDLLLDVAPVVVILLEAVFTLIRGPHAHGGYLLVAVLIADAVALGFSRRFPVAVLAVVLALGTAVTTGPAALTPALFALFAVARLRDRWTVAAAAVASAAALAAGVVLHREEGVPVELLISQWVALGLAVAVGLWIRARGEQVAGLREQAVTEERVRIARELHDIVSHNVSLMVVQAQALAVGAADERQRDGLDQLAGLGREAMAEMHRMLGVLRLDGAGADRAPQPGVGELGALIARTTEAGVGARLRVEGEPRELPPAVDLSAYRIVQEALTNVIRHADAGHVDVTLTYGSRELVVSVVDDGAGDTGGGDGHGLIGMRERVALVGGTLRTGTAGPGAGYRLLATLPVD
ncbi:MAG TPA: histidine kinase [Solirubrobacterales bacterium]